MHFSGGLHSAHKFNGLMPSRAGRNQVPDACETLNPIAFDCVEDTLLAEFHALGPCLAAPDEIIEQAYQLHSLIYWKGPSGHLHTVWLRVLCTLKQQVRDIKKSNHIHFVEVFSGN
jgi:hypothetical protein